MKRRRRRRRSELRCCLTYAASNEKDESYRGKEARGAEEASYFYIGMHVRYEGEEENSTKLPTR